MKNCFPSEVKNLEPLIEIWEMASTEDTAIAATMAKTVKSCMTLEIESADVQRDPPTSCLLSINEVSTRSGVPIGIN